MPLEDHIDRSRWQALVEHPVLEPRPRRRTIPIGTRRWHRSPTATLTATYAAIVAGIDTRAALVRHLDCSRGTVNAAVDHLLALELIVGGPLRPVHATTPRRRCGTGASSRPEPLVGQEGDA